MERYPRSDFNHDRPESPDSRSADGDAMVRWTSGTDYSDAMPCKKTGMLVNTLTGPRGAHRRSGYDRRDGRGFP